VSARPARSRPTGPQLPHRPTLQPNVEGIHIGARPTESQTPEATGSVTHRAPESDSPKVPRWRTLIRKEARLREDQAEALAALRRRLTAARSDRTEVITDNTLIRIAVDLLLDHADELTGDTEAELCESVSHRAPKSQTP
jgi:hypothetical protein